MTNRGKSLLLLLVPLAMLGFSFLTAPYLFLASNLAPSVSRLPDAPVLVFRYGGVRFFYTSDDLLHPELWSSSAPGKYYRAILFDTYAAGEGTAQRVPAWVVQIGRALLLRSVDGVRVPGREATAADQDLVRNFTRVLSPESALARGENLVFTLPEQSTFRRLSGIEAVAALAIKDPGPDQIAPALKGASQLAPQAIQGACEALRKKGVRSIGVPFLPLSDQLGTALPPDQSWGRIIDYVKESASANRLESVVFGGFGLDPDNRADNDQAFHRAWAASRARLEPDETRLAQEPIRLAGLILLAVILRSLFQNQPLPRLWILAAAVTAASLAASVAAVTDWLRPLLGSPSPLLELDSKLILALLTGLFMRQIVEFLAKLKEIVLHA